MAYYNQEEEDEQQGLGPQQTGPGGSGVISAGSAQSGGNTQAKQGQQDRGSSFVGITDYLNANKNQAEKLGDQAGGVITKSADDARAGINQLNTNFNQKAGSAATIDQNVLGKVNQAETLADQEKQQIKSAYNAQYGGPNSLMDLSDDYNQAGQKLNKAKQNVQAAGTEEGRAGLITQINEKPRTAGITNFDSLLLQTGGGRNKVENAAQSNQDVTQDILGRDNLAAQQKAAQIKAQTDATRQQTQGAVGGAKTSLADAINQRLQEMRGGLTAQNNQIVQDLGDNAYGLDQATMDAFGLGDGQISYNVNPFDYFTQGDISKINAGNVAKDEEYARYLALNELMGANPELLNPNDRAQAGTADQYVAKIDKDRLSQDLTKRAGDFDRLYNIDKVDVSDGSDFFKDVIYSPTNTSVGNQSYQRHFSQFTPKQLEAEAERLRVLGQNSGAQGSAIMAKRISDYLTRLKKETEGQTFKKNPGV